ncbi:hypothetical protein ACIHCQ_44220, partial [Streptomyces sp. NPDC052236]|uniref:hypothetical protein n=1 Tax=Streptomyces sp. NPDC052236 TaxID=3365686 RepID=UPI0037CEF58F
MGVFLPLAALMRISATKVELYAAIRRDDRAGVSMRALERKYGVTRRTIRRALEAMLAMVTASGHADDARPPRRTIELADTESSAAAINGAGHAVGVGGSHAVLWPGAAPAVDLGSLPDAASSGATAINDAGVVVGMTMIDGDVLLITAARWSADGTITDLGTLPEGYGWATDINESETIVGSSQTENDSSHAVRWNAAGDITDLGTLRTFTESFAYAVNESNVVVGQSGFTDLTGPAVRWEADGTITELALPPGTTDAAAYAINDLG